MGAHNETSKLVECWAKQLRPLGWRLEKTARHYKFIPPDKSKPAVVVPSSMGKASLKVVIANLRRIGAPL